MFKKQDLLLGFAPAEEDFARIGSDGYRWRAWHECRALVGQLRRHFGPEPPGTRLSVKEVPHDRGPYLTVVCTFPVGDEPGTSYAYRCEAELPREWDDEAKAFLAPVTPAKRKSRKKKGVAP